MNYKPSSELQRKSEENINNEARAKDWYQKYMTQLNKDVSDRYRDKRVSAEYEQFLNNIGHP